MRHTYLFTISQKHLDEQEEGQRSVAQQAIGRLLPCDIGKRVYRSGAGIVYAENATQRDARLAKGN